MIPLSYNTPGLLFPAVSLLMLAYTNRFLGLASLVRHLIAQYQTQHDASHRRQIENLRQRIILLRHTQALGVTSLLGCTISLLAIAVDLQTVAQWSFLAALLLMLASLGVSLREIYLSGRALNIELDRLYDAEK